MHDTILTPYEAWEDFLSYWKTTGEPVYNDIAQATRDKNGRRKNRDGKPYVLGVGRIERLLNKYCPGRYEFRGVFILHEK